MRTGSGLESRVSLRTNSLVHADSDWLRFRFFVAELLVPKNVLHKRRKNVTIARRFTSESQVESDPRSNYSTLDTLASPVSGRSPMLVRDVLQSKGRLVISIDSDATVSEAVAKLVQNNIGSLPIVEHGGRLVGVVSERDVLRLIHNKGEGFGRLRVAEVMTKDPITCHLEDEVDEIMGKMSDRHIAKLPVLSDGQLVGVISVGDVIKVLYDKVHDENRHLRSYIHGAV
jgi:CBS domain-containing protein